MARKTLLTEGEIRRFMKLANMGPVGNERLEGYSLPGNREEDALEDELSDMDSEADREGDEIGDLEADLGAADDDLAADDAAMDDMADDAMAGEGMMISVDDFMAALETALEEVTGEEVDSVVDLGADAEAEDAEGGDVALDGPEAEPVADVDVGAEVEDVEELPMQEQIVDKVAARVAARLVQENRKSQMTEELTERIFKRLVGKTK